MIKNPGPMTFHYTDKINLRLRARTGTAVRRLTGAALRRGTTGADAEDSNDWNAHFDGA
ncbi:MAG: hypothetical protein ACREUW_15035 [Burkholderiales bacterium]